MPDDRLEYLTPKDLFEREYTEQTFYLNGILAEGQVLVIVSQPGHGKSYLVELMAFIMGKGADWFDKFVAPEPVPVLYILTDGSVDDLKERAEGPAVLGYKDAQVKFLVSAGIDLADARGENSSTFKQLSKEIKAEGFKVICVDSLYSSIKGDPSEAKTAQALAAMMAAFGREHPEVAWIILHHSKKISTTKDGVPIKDPNPFLGSNYLNAMVDQMWEYEKVDKDQARLSQLKVRSNRQRWNEPWFVEIDLETGVLTPQGHKLSDREKSFKLWLQTLGKQTFTKKEVDAWAVGQGVEARTAQNYMTKLRKDGRIEDVARGVYRYVPLTGQPQLDSTG